MSWIPVQSSNLRAVAYEPDREVLGVTFHHGGAYLYFQVPAATFRGLLGATSKGRYHHQHIKGRYAYRRIA